MSDEKKVSIALPGEWALQKVFGPALSEIGEDLKRAYSKGRDHLIAAASRKIDDFEDGKRTNLRVTRDVLWNGSLAEDEVCAEYFGGCLAASRSEDGKEDDSIQFVDVIKSLSSRQLRLHYIVYHSLNINLVKTGSPIKIAHNEELMRQHVYFATRDVQDRLGLEVYTNLNVLHRQGLICEYKYENHPYGDGLWLSYTMATPTIFGVLLYAVAHNRLNQWLDFGKVDFGDFPDVPLPLFFAPSLDQLTQQVRDFEASIGGLHEADKGN